MKFPNYQEIVVHPVGKNKKLIITSEFFPNRGDPQKRGDVFVSVQFGNQMYSDWGARNVSGLIPKYVQWGLQRIRRKHRRDFGVEASTYLVGLSMFLLHLNLHFGRKLHANQRLKRERKKNLKR